MQLIDIEKHHQRPRVTIKITSVMSIKHFQILRLRK